MILDSLLLFSDGQAVTAAAASTNYIDTSVVRDLGQGEDLYIFVHVDVAFTDGSSNSTLTVALYGDSTTSFSPDGSDTLFTIPALSAIGYVAYAKLSPSMAALAYRYIELYYTPNNGDLSTGTLTAGICKNIQKFASYADGITIS